MTHSGRTTKSKTLQWYSIALPLLGCAGGATEASEAARAEQTVRSHVEMGSVSFDSVTLAELSVSETNAGAHWRFEYVGRNQGDTNDDRMVSLTVAQDEITPWGSFDITAPGSKTTEATLRYVEYARSTAPMSQRGAPSAGSGLATSPNAASAQQNVDYREYAATAGRLEVIRESDTQAVVKLREIRVTSVDDATNSLTFDGTITTQLKRACYAFGGSALDTPEMSNAAPSPQISSGGAQTSGHTIHLDQALATEFCKQQSRIE